MPAITTPARMLVEYRPRVHEFDIGRQPGLITANVNQIIVCKRDVPPNADGLFDRLIYGLVSNIGEEDFTFSVKDSDDNAKADPYASINIRTGGTNVASVMVVPRGVVEFTIEVATKAYLLFLADDQTISSGRLVLTHFLGGLLRRDVQLSP